jgi:hypothetical protein
MLGFGNDKGEKKKKTALTTTLGEAYIQPAIDHVIGAMDCDSDDFDIRHKIATSMKRAITMSTNKDGDVREPKQTIIYRFATLLDGCKSFEELENKCLKAFDGRGDCRADKLLTKFDFDWTMPFTIPSFKIKPKPPRKNSKEWLRLEEEKNLKENPPVAETPAESIATPDTIEKQEILAEGILAQAVMRIEALERSLDKTTNQLEKTTQQFKLHEHRDGKVVVVTEV